MRVYNFSFDRKKIAKEAKEKVFLSSSSNLFK